MSSSGWVKRRNAGWILLIASDPIRENVYDRRRRDRVNGEVDPDSTLQGSE